MRIHLMIMLLLLLGSLCATAQPLLLSIPQDLTATPGMSGLHVPIQANDTTGLEVISAEMQLHFDPQLLRPISATVTDGIALQSLLTYQVDEAGGSVQIALAQALPLQGAGLLVSLFFDVLAETPGGTTALSLTDVRLNSGAVTAQVEAGLVQFVPTPPPTAVQLSLPGGFSIIPRAQDVQIPLMLDNAAGQQVVSTDLTIQYDTAVLTATGAELVGTIAAGGGLTVDVDDAAGQMSVALAHPEPLAEAGVLVYLTFDVDSADPAAYSVLSFQTLHLNGGQVLAVAIDGDVALPVTLSNFAAVVDSRENRVILSWQTETEFANLGFLLSRSGQRDEGYIRLAWVESKGEGSHYQFIDETARPGETYFYRLEDRDMRGVTSFRQVLALDWSKHYHVPMTWGQVKRR